MDEQLGVVLIAPAWHQCGLCPLFPGLEDVYRAAWLLLVQATHLQVRGVVSERREACGWLPSFIVCIGVS